MAFYTAKSHQMLHVDMLDNARYFAEVEKILIFEDKLVTDCMNRTATKRKLDHVCLLALVVNHKEHLLDGMHRERFADGVPGVFVSIYGVSTVRYRNRFLYLPFFFAVVIIVSHSVSEFL